MASPNVKIGNYNVALVTVEAGGPSNPPQLQRTGMIAISNMRSMDLIDLPFRKRILVVPRAQEQNQYICNQCGRAFASYRALGCHKGHHTRRRRAHKEGDQENYEAPKMQRCHQCMRCSRSFATRKGLGGHKRHCKGPPAVEEKGEASTRCFDLNEMPHYSGEEEEILALQWYTIHN
ncbi:hypothetical protein BUALT_Bualt02G0175300 [Buddleja alternifolia]|uniref:C2H2-type domain-containing protein n=1 Tax=Buddleja alternifolia TaxID=168488 RepID=A0AAV6Y242_9LAMI|nr:hypothetical protein BUALT_Bualt02G0175300 [Buddleja alternifolia]